MEWGRKVAFAAALVALAASIAMSSCGGGQLVSGKTSDGGATEAASECYGACSGPGGSGSRAISPSLDAGVPHTEVSVCPGAPDGTTISGKVYDPAGKNPLYGIAVYNPVFAPVPLPSGANCDQCTGLYPRVLAFAYTDETGSFFIKHAASGPTTSLVVQIGKWRNVYTLNVKSCQDNPQPDKSIRLPIRANPLAGMTLPDIAVSTGAADSLECIFHRIGIDNAEYVGGTSTGGHIHVFTGTSNGGPGASVTGSPASSTTLWDSLAHIMPYDYALFSCEGGETNGITDSARTVLFEYVSNGGRAFMTHQHYAWFTPTGPFSTLNPPMATWDAGTNVDNDPVGGVFSTTIGYGQPFPKAVSMAKWLANVGATQGGKLYPIHHAYDNATVTDASAHSALWIASDETSATPGGAQVLSIDPGSESCGRVVYSDMHVSGGPNDPGDPHTDYPGVSTGVVPTGCGDRDLTPQEKALEFLIFDLPGCPIMF